MALNRRGTNFLECTPVGGFAPNVILRPPEAAEESGWVWSTDTYTPSRPFAESMLSETEGLRVTDDGRFLVQVFGRLDRVIGGGPGGVRSSTA